MTARDSDKDYVEGFSSDIDDTVTILIAHNGESISPEQINDIFERFYKGAKGQYGIGLAMAEDIITRHGGTLQVLSTDEETCFEIVLPNN